MKNVCVHELATLAGVTDETVAMAGIMQNVSTCGLLKAVKDGKVTVDQLNGTNGQSITVGEIRKIAGPRDGSEIDDFPDTVDGFIDMLESLDDEPGQDQQVA